MAALQSAMMSYLLLILRHPFFGSGQFEIIRNCSPESTTAECGTQVDLLCTPSFLAGKRFTSMHVRALNDPNRMECLMEGVGKNISLNGRFQCFLSESEAGLQLNASKITDTGEYIFFISTEDSNYEYTAHLQINGSKKPPHISLTLENEMVVCKVDGGCPVGQIEWSDNSRKNWTKNANVTEKDGLIVSILHLEALSTIEEIHCTVSYQRMGNTENKTSSISMTESNGPESVISDSNVTRVQIPVSISLLVCAILVVVIIWQRRRKYQGQRQVLGCSGVHDTEMQALKEENRLQ